MEFGVLGSDGLVGSGNGFASLSSDHPAKQKWCGSATFLNKETSGISPDYDNGDWKVTKIAKLSDDLTPTKSLLPLKHSSSFVFSNEEQEQNMLSFSSPKLENKSLQSTTFPYFQHPNSYYSRSSGSSCSGSVNASMCYVNRVRGGFTPSQWFELEQQALIYKYILANQPIPPNLLIPIRRAFESAGFCSFPGGLLRPNSFGYGWGPFQLGLANSTDPEPGRCRRTDGKKWRCSRDAVPDQKYCERHMNRGRHRSRKPVEGHSGHSISGGTTKKASNSTTSVMNMTSTSSALVVPGGGPSNSFALNLNGSKDLQHVPSNLLSSSPVNRLMVNKANISQGMQDTSHATGIDILSPRISLSSNGNTFSVAESTAGDFAFLTSDAILSTTKTGSSVSRNYPQGSDPQYSPHAFIDDQTSMLWPKLQTHTDRTTQLSMSIPPAAEITSSTSSPTRERDALSPLRLSRELDSVQMGLGMYTTVSNEQKPISWESSMGGPLGEVLNVTTSSSSGDQSKSVPALNLLSRGSWEGSPQLASSPTGVLQRTALGYFSNSSAGSSPRPDNGFSLMSSSSSLPL